MTLNWCNAWLKSDMWPAKRVVDDDWIVDDWAGTDDWCVWMVGLQEWIGLMIEQVFIGFMIALMIECTKRENQTLINDGFWCNWVKSRILCFKNVTVDRCWWIWKNLIEFWVFDYSWLWQIRLLRCVNCLMKANLLECDELMQHRGHPCLLICVHLVVVAPS